MKKNILFQNTTDFIVGNLTLILEEAVSSCMYWGTKIGILLQSEQARERRSICRDELKCKELGVPFSVEMITNYPVEEFNSLLRMHRLSEEQLNVIKDIRRRGKNKVRL